MSHTETKEVAYPSERRIKIGDRVCVPERTCRSVSDPPKGGGFWPAPHFECSECGFEHVSVGYVYYCPGCGRKVVDL